MAIKLSKEIETRLTDSIKQFYVEYMDGEIGDLKATLLLDFCIKEIGPCIYNKAIADAQAIMHEKVDDLDGSCYQQEFDFWKK
jgi:uncharacterized protein (DUF2164 family)